MDNTESKYAIMQ